MKVIEYVAKKGKENRTVTFKKYKVKKKDGVTSVLKEDKLVYMAVEF